MAWLILLYLITGPSIFAYRFGHDPKWRDDMEEDGDVFCRHACLYVAFWPFVLIGLYFWKDSDETGEAGKDAE